MRAWERLHREFPGQRLQGGRALEVRLTTRGASERPIRRLAGELAKALDVKVRRNGRVANPKPNAPLLIRIVRHPFALDPVRVQRRKGEGPRARQQRVRMPWATVLAETRDLRGPIGFQNPLRNFDRLWERARVPPVDEWLAAAGREESPR